MSVDERFYPKPHEFIPERWLRDTDDEISSGRNHPFGMKPFGFGQRSCLGQRFAENEIYICILKVHYVKHAENDIYICILKVCCVKQSIVLMPLLFKLILYNYSLLLRSIRVFMDLRNDIHRSH